MKRIAAGLLVACALVMSVLVHPAQAAQRAVAGHPLGNFSVNRHNGLVVTPDELRVRHIEDLAEIPTAQARPELDEMGTTAWAGRRCRTAAAAIRVVADGRTVTAAVRSAAARLRPGQAGLPTLRVECALSTPGGGESIVFRDNGVAGTVGWREVTARGDRMTLTASDVPTSSRTALLTDYPADLLSSPLNQRGATLRIRRGGPALAEGAGSGAAGGPLARGADGPTRAFTELVAQRKFTAGFAALALLIAMALGALHALAPGHGKTIMAAYAAGGGQRAKRDIFTLGATVTVTHTAGVLVLGLLIASGSLLAPAAIYPWLGIAGGVLLATVGATLLRRAVRAHRRRHDHAEADGHGHGHGHGHGPGNGHGNGHGQGHGHGHGWGSGKADRRGGAAVLMGFAGGLVPSPSAVVVLVGAAAIGRAWFGVVLVLAYGIGLALSLVLLGLLVVGSGRMLARRVMARRGARRSLLPVGTATAVVLMGVGLVLRSLPAAFG